MVITQTSLKDWRAGISAGAAVAVILTLFFEESAAFLRSTGRKVKQANRLAVIVQRFVSALTRPLGTFGSALRYPTSVKSGGLSVCARKGAVGIFCARVAV